jgi:hypothetical protein
LNYLKDEQIKEAYKTFNDTLSVINSKYTENEKSTFDLKRQEAEKVIAG